MCLSAAGLVGEATAPAAPARWRAVGGGVPAEREAPEALALQTFAQPIPLPAIALEDLDGRPVRLGAFRGRMVLLNFWATWCLPCRQEMPAMATLHRLFHGRGLVLLGVNFKESARDVAAFLREHGIGFPSVLDPDGSASAKLRVLGLPVTFLLDAEGRLVWKAIGAREWDGPPARAYFDGLLPSGPGPG